MIPLHLSCAGKEHLNKAARLPGDSDGGRVEPHWGAGLFSLDYEEYPGVFSRPARLWFGLHMRGQGTALILLQVRIKEENKKS